MEFIKKNKYFLLASIAFAIVYSLISLVNHYYFRTHAFDLGLYTNAAYKYAHFQIADTGMVEEFSKPILGGHFDLYLILVSPLIYVFGTYTLLIVQIGALLFGGLGVYKYFQLIAGSNKNTPILAAIYFWLFFGVFGALSYDYHSVVVASSLVPWFFYTVHLEKIKQSYLMLLLIIISQENISLWMIFVCLGLLIEYRKDHRLRIHLIVMACLSLIYFGVVISVIIPSLSNQHEYGGFVYSCLGSNPFEALQTLIIHPIDSLIILFTNHNNSEHGAFVKAELFIILIASGLPFLFKKPQYLIMLLPILFQKLFHDNYIIWGIGGQYNIEFAPIMTIGVFRVLTELKKSRLREKLSYIVIALVGIATFKTMDSTILFTNKSQIRFYQQSHYQRDYIVKEVNNMISLIPLDAKVSAQSPFVSHLALREHIYLFPIVKDAEFIIYSRFEDSYPLNSDQFNLKIKELEESGEWEVICNKEVTVLKKIGK